MQPCFEPVPAHPYCHGNIVDRITAYASHIVGGRSGLKREIALAAQDGIRHAIQFLLIAAAVGIPAAAQAGRIIDLATEAEGLIGKGEGMAAYEKMRQSMGQAAEQIPFDIRKAFFVTEKPVLFGNYSRAKSNEFPVGSSLITYAEP